MEEETDVEPLRLEVAGHGVHVAREGVGPPVVALHSTGLSARQWGGLAARLGDRFTVLRPDWIGCGRSDDHRGPAPFDLEQDRGVLRAVLAQTGPAHLVGHSYGGTLAMWAALEDSAQVRSLAVYEPVLVGLLHSTRDGEGLAHLRATMPASWFEPEVLGTDAWLAFFVDWWQGPGTWAGLTDAQRAPFLRSADKLAQEVLQQLVDRTPHHAYVGLQAPLLVLHGTTTPPAARRMSELLAEVTGAAEVVVEGAGHMGPLTHAKEVLRAIEAHVDTAEAGTV